MSKKMPSRRTRTSVRPKARQLPPSGEQAHIDSLKALLANLDATKAENELLLRQLARQLQAGLADTAPVISERRRRPRKKADD